MRRLSILFILYALLIRNYGLGVNGEGDTSSDVPTSDGTGGDTSGKENVELPSPVPGPEPGTAGPAGPQVAEPKVDTQSVEGSQLATSPPTGNGTKSVENPTEISGTGHDGGSDQTKQAETSLGKSNEETITQNPPRQETADQNNPAQEPGSKGPIPSPPSTGELTETGSEIKTSELGIVGSGGSPQESAKSDQSDQSAKSDQSNTSTLTGSQPNTDNQTTHTKGETGSSNSVQSNSELGGSSATEPKITSPESSVTVSNGSSSGPTKPNDSTPTSPAPSNSDKGSDVPEIKKSVDTEGKGSKPDSKPDASNPQTEQSDNAHGTDSTLESSIEGTGNTSLKDSKQISKDAEKTKKVVEGTGELEKPTISDSGSESDKAEVIEGQKTSEIQVPSSEQNNTHTSDLKTDPHSPTLPPSADNPVSTDQNSGSTLELPQSDSPSEEQLPDSIRIIPIQNFDIKSAMLRNYKGLKITGQCNSNFVIFFVPYIYIEVDTKLNQISIISTKKKVNGTTEGVPTQSIDFKSEGDTLQNQCGDNKTFKIVVYLDSGVLYVKWKVYDSSTETEPNTNVDVRKYQLKNLETPITSIQVHTVKRTLKNVTLESKNYTINDNLPEKCEAIASDCFLHGNVDIEKCYKCALLYRKNPLTDECYNYLSNDYKKLLNTEVVTAQSEDEINYELMGHIDNILEGIYNIDENNNNKELKKYEELNDEIKKDILLYCKELKESDVSGTLEEFVLGDVEDIFYNLTKLITNNTEISISKLKNKLMNPAICLKDVNQWGEKKKGLVLPELISKDFENLNGKNKNDDTTMNHESDKKLQEGFDGVIDLPLPHENEFAGYTTIEDLQYCNDEYCDRLKDNNSCISKIDVEEQGNCATSWLFASKFHLDTIGCMKGHENFSASALYVVNCSKKDSKDKCLIGSNPLEFLNIIDENKFLPTTSNLPYSYKKVGEECPKTMDNWTNLWKDVKLLKYENNDKSLNANGYISYQSEDFKDNFSEYINLIKQEIQNKGSVMAYVNSKYITSYDFNGSKVHKLCGSVTPDMIVNIIGYGKYINENNEVKSYWIVRNSWGKHWADEGNFKVDIETPENCKHNFIHTFATFNIYIPFVKKSIQSESEINLYYSKISPDFYNNLYFKNLDAADTSEDSIIEGQDEPASISTQEETHQPTGEGNQEESKLPEEKTPKEVGRSEIPSTGTQEKSQELEQQPQPQPQPQPQSQPEPQAKVEGQGQVVEQAQGQVQEREQPNGGKQVSGTETTKNVTGQEETQVNSTGAESSKAKAPSTSVNSSEQQTGKVTEQQPAQQTCQQPARAQIPNFIPQLQVGIRLEFMHILKQIKNGKVKMNLVKYGSELSMIDDRICSRVYAINPEKKNECEQFCAAKWSICQFDISPGYCLAKLYNSDDCYFCYV
ncbi:serine repeat antigen 1 [Plasmodium berghei]|uniref:Serine repeat antigen 1 n=2 Tax=Plasmodium berghei TaxID=5821 RepID=A0A509AH14_PLABA|nr:serine repeat antigen 1 [Plasmodium berghei ANKA]CXH93288.1 serine repeat antigen 1 [Plasmodium berghei]SCL90774.1 serine repeat antigen 1 [Plasmodium berghei]SCM15351.1 serine repeat antigen 1 [Plasmodium berghei]SCN22152.1 serine repeat antigen 1 [Plasmodium berghei]VUC54090.1 serine repeat antigen 1 [Plasmodium berghei ANKA]|eukprot:XP_034419935.1 serine repeat antigen 1 [Plasmodium berghei ANKA]